MSELLRQPSFDGLHPVGEGGGVRVRLIEPRAILSVLARSGKVDLLAEKAQSEFGLVLKNGPFQSSASSLTALGIGPNRWLVLADDADEIMTKFRGLASMSDHTDGYSLFGISGKRARDALAKGVPVDIHPQTFGMSDVAVTLIAHIGAVVWKNENDEFVVSVFRSYAESFWEWLALSAAEFGVEIVRG